MDSDKWHERDFKRKHTKSIRLTWKINSIKKLLIWSELSCLTPTGHLLDKVAKYSMFYMG